MIFMRNEKYCIKFYREYLKYYKCQVFTGNLLIGDGESNCHPSDNFCKETGRKIALERAVARLDRDTRREIWRLYFDRTLQT